jgi:hypothetical protein
MRPSLTLAALPLLFLAACSSDPAPAKVTPAPAVSQIPTVDPTTDEPVAEPGDPQGELACQLVAKAVVADSLLDKGVTAAIVKAAKASDTESLRFDALQLQDHYEMARAAQGDSDEFAMSAGLLTEGIEMQTDCVEAGLGD